ncbi:MAG TPA: DHA2 family efflux MFS transporter permease subunit [Candidatus Dormibacteraeota bacterium]|nr:DHA2 family efflux MFS transporter permease subunit [Candidatus Dormibacteraeota bacterium]
MDSQPPATGALPGIPQVSPWIVATAVMVATFMEVLDTTVVNVSLPHIAGSLSVTPDEATWTLTSYLVANAIVLPITGWLANYFGRKRLLIAAVIGFTTASFLCGLAPSLTVLIFFRVVQGATGGVLQPISQAVLLEAFPPEDRGKAMAFWGLGIVVAPMLGPVIGGWLTQNYSWRWVFYINIPVGVISVVMSSLFLFDPPYIRRRIGESIDYWGLGLLAVGIGTMQVILDKGQEADWFGSRWVVDFAIIAAVTLAAFLIHELVARHPVIDLRIFKERTYATGVFLMTLLGFGLYGALVILPLLLQTLLGYPALDAGLAMFPRGLGSFLMMPLVGLLMAKIDARKLLFIGTIGTALSMYLLSVLNLNLGYWNIFWPQFLQGLSMALVFVPLTTITMDAISLEGMGNATSIFNLMRNVGGSVGIAMATTLVARATQSHSALLGANVTPFSGRTQQAVAALRQAFILRGFDPVTATRQAYAAIFGLVQRQSAMLSYNYVFGIMTVVFISMIPLVFLLRRPRRRGPMAAH